MQLVEKELGQEHIVDLVHSSEIVKRLRIIGLNPLFCRYESQDHLQLDFSHERNYCLLPVDDQRPYDRAFIKCGKCGVGHFSGKRRMSAVEI